MQSHNTFFYQHITHHRSIASNIHGLAVDRLLQAQIVTPNGANLLVNECQNTDLFFAIRGGGGGTFGVILETWTVALPKLTFQA